MRRTRSNLHGRRAAARPVGFNGHGEESDLASSPAISPVPASVSSLVADHRIRARRARLGFPWSGPFGYGYGQLGLRTKALPRLLVPRFRPPNHIGRYLGTRPTDSASSDAARRNSVPLPHLGTVRFGDSSPILIQCVTCLHRFHYTLEG